MSEFRYVTERLILRDWHDQDWVPFLEHTNTGTVMRWLGGVLDKNKQHWMRERLEGYRRDHGFTFWPVERKQDGGHLAGEIIGFCGLKMSNQQGGPMGQHEIGWRLREDAWGHGYAREAAAASLKLGFERFDAPHILALTVDGNVGSWRLMDRLGMRRRKDLDFESNDFGTDKVIVYSITYEEWERKK